MSHDQTTTVEETNESHVAAQLQPQQKRSGSARNRRHSLEYDNDDDEESDDENNDGNGNEEYEDAAIILILVKPEGELGEISDHVQECIKTGLDALLQKGLPGGELTWKARFKGIVFGLSGGDVMQNERNERMKKGISTLANFPYWWTKTASDPAQDMPRMGQYTPQEDKDKSLPPWLAKGFPCLTVCIGADFPASDKPVSLDIFGNANHLKVPVVIVSSTGKKTQTMLKCLEKDKQHREDYYKEKYASKNGASMQDYKPTHAAHVCF